MFSDCVKKLHILSLSTTTLQSPNDRDPRLKTVDLADKPGLQLVHYSRSGQTVYFRGVKTRLSPLGTGDVPRGSDSTFLTKLGGHKRTTGEA